MITESGYETNTQVRYIFDTNQVNRMVCSKLPYYVGAQLWNDLPVEIQVSENGERFKSVLKNIIIS